jgi:hypothetical protein
MRPPHTDAELAETLRLTPPSMPVLIRASSPPLSVPGLSQAARATDPPPRTDRFAAPCKAVPWAVRARSEPRAGHGCGHPMGRRNNKCKSSCGSQPNGPSELPRTGHSPPALARQCELVLRR